MIPSAVRVPGRFRVRERAARPLEAVYSWSCPECGWATKKTMSSLRRAISRHNSRLHPLEPNDR